jgi:hypothetical protein
MKMVANLKIIGRLEELILLGERIKGTQSGLTATGEALITDRAVNLELSNQWFTSCLGLLSMVFGEQSDHYKRLKKASEKSEYLTSILNGMGIIKAAKDDIEKGWLLRINYLLQAEIFSDFLEQASHLLDNGYQGPAAVVTGAVLEDGLRKLCVRNEIELPKNPKLDWMNIELAKKGVYNILKQKRITALADIRNSAAHGKWDEFTPDDVKRMIEEVEQFMSDSLK